MRSMAILCVAVLAVSSASAVDIWATDNLGEYHAGGVGDRIIKFDSTNPTVPVVIGQTAVGATLMGGLDFDWPGGTLYAYGQSGSIGLYTVNQSTGVATAVGGTAVSGITDIAFNPVDGVMYGTGGGSIYTIDTGTGNTVFSGTINGIPGILEVGLAADSQGTLYVHDLVNDGIYKLDASYNATLLYALPYNSNYSQGMTIDWSRGDTGYHGAFNATTYRTELWQFDTAGTSYAFVGNIGPINGSTGLPEYETGDLAIMPIPEPASMLLLGIGGLLLVRRR